MSAGKVESQVCSVCGTHLPLEAFHRQPKNRNGRRGSCASCDRLLLQRWRKANPEKVAAQWARRNERAARRRVVREEARAKVKAAAAAATEKQCTACLRTLPITAFRVDPRYTGGRVAWCSECFRAKGIAWTLKIKAQPKSTPLEKQCPACKEVKPASEFKPDKSRKAGLYPYCKTCDAARAAAHWPKIRDRIRVRRRAQRALNRDAVRARCRKRREFRQVRHVEAMLAAEARGERPELTQQHVITGLKSRARKHGGESLVTLEQWRALKEACDFRCCRCGRQEPEIKLTLDHIVPVVKGGTSHIGNIQPLCKPCNSCKHTKSTDYRPEAARRLFAPII